MASTLTQTTPEKPGQHSQGAFRSPLSGNCKPTNLSPQATINPCNDTSSGDVPSEAELSYIVISRVPNFLPQLRVFLKKGCEKGDMESLITTCEESFAFVQEIRSSSALIELCVQPVYKMLCSILEKSVAKHPDLVAFKDRILAGQTKSDYQTFIQYPVGLALDRLSISVSAISNVAEEVRDSLSGPEAP